jgi:hypothetical protein
MGVLNYQFLLLAFMILLIFVKCILMVRIESANVRGVPLFPPLRDASFKMLASVFWVWQKLNSRYFALP